MNTGASPRGLAVSVPISAQIPTQREYGVNTLVKELLRIFTRRIPGSLVPDSLVRGFIHAYRQLRGTQERLDFFRLITRELGLSVPEVSAAVRLWDSAVARGGGGGAAAPLAYPPASRPAAAAAAGLQPVEPINQQQREEAPQAPAAAAAPPAAPPAAPAALQWDVAYRAADRLASAATPLYSQLFVPISQAPDGMKFLVDMRADLMAVVAAAAVAASAPPAPPGATSGSSSSSSKGASGAAAPAGAAGAGAGAVAAAVEAAPPAGPASPVAATAAATAVAAGAVAQGGSTVAAAHLRALPPTMSPEEAAHLRAMAEQLRQLLAEWFSVGLLHLQHISWEESPAALLERVMRVEAVHPLGGSWEELRRRLGPRRRVFAFTHPCMPGEPLVVLHTALMDRPASCIGDILEHHHDAHADLANHDHHHTQQLAAAGPSAPASSPDAAPAAAAPAASRSGGPSGSGSSSGSGPSSRRSSSAAGPSTAVFYSISSSQPGLSGIELGHFLIQRVAERLTAEHPSLRQLVTLSPLPNFRAWLTSQLQQQLQQQLQHQQQQQLQPQPLLLPAEQVAVVGLARAMGWEASGPQQAPHAAAATGVSGCSPAAAAAAALSWLLEGDRWLSHGNGGRTAAAAAPYATGSSAQADTAAAAGAAAAADAAAAAAAAMFSGPFAQPPPRPATPAAAGGAPVPDADAEAVLKPLLLRLAARYLVREKRRSFALCPVANFHLRNGASLWRINWRADMSDLGLRRSLGIMCNYQYQLDSVYDNNRAYLLQHEVMTHPQVQELLRGH
ncbi:hypothetical protein HYH02_009935 [Chlamydomonas schloesseri]|uniref:Malonyl-CoA decarboxylase C-terminal domain-containing protein n=1 Tax=Chlamydomonas schloesseri TaxID=2026947 RepID=A0A835W5H9_9CHLO|nr:hypothetical protein HYH02_009935 [Chlamydomonas schloesseri]|eukprot:KAG2441342.1 hypothetical protein HYH02_009935 [Chlamydomonas schloesseri]